VATLNRYAFVHSTFGAFCVTSSKTMIAFTFEIAITALVASADYSKVIKHWIFHFYLSVDYLVSPTP
jgi:hypothetical protein